MLRYEGKNEDIKKSIEKIDLQLPKAEVAINDIRKFDNNKINDSERKKLENFVIRVRILAISQEVLLSKTKEGCELSMYRTAIENACIFDNITQRIKSLVNEANDFIETHAPQSKKIIFEVPMLRNLAQQHTIVDDTIGKLLEQTAFCFKDEDFGKNSDKTQTLKSKDDVQRLMSVGLFAVGGLAATGAIKGIRAGQAAWQIGSLTAISVASIGSAVYLNKTTSEIVQERMAPTKN